MGQKYVLDCKLGKLTQETEGIYKRLGYYMQYYIQLKIKLQQNLLKILEIMALIKNMYFITN